MIRYGGGTHVIMFITFYGISQTSLMRNEKNDYTMYAIKVNEEDKDYNIRIRAEKITE